MALQEKLESTVAPVCLAQWEALVHRAQPDSLDLQDCPESASKDLWEFQERGVSRVHQVQQDRKVSQAQQDSQVLQGPLVPWAQLVLREQGDSRVGKALRVLKVTWDPWESRDPRVTKEMPAIRV